MAAVFRGLRGADISDRTQVEQSVEILVDRIGPGSSHDEANARTLEGAGVSSNLNIAIQQLRQYFPWATASMASMIFTYPVHRHRFPEIPTLIS